MVPLGLTGSPVAKTLVCGMDQVVPLHTFILIVKYIYFQKKNLYLFVCRLH